MRIFAALILFASLGWNVVPARGAQTKVGDYADLAAWADGDAADAAQFQSELKQADSAAKVAAALRATAARQRKTTNAIIALVGAHPELRDLPMLGLDEEGLRAWLQTHPDGQARIKRAPAAARKIGERLRSAIARLDRDQSAQAAVVANLRKYPSDPQVAAAIQELTKALEDNRHLLLKIFS